jgi:DNA-binding NarL/FixJ family response regulator
MRSLTRLETQILALVARGYLNKEIARALSYALSTIKNALGMLFRELGVHNRRELAARAWRDGLVR